MPVGGLFRFSKYLCVSQDTLLLVKDLLGGRMPQSVRLYLSPFLIVDDGIGQLLLLVIEYLKSLLPALGFLPPDNFGEVFSLLSELPEPVMKSFFGLSSILAALILRSCLFALRDEVH